MRNDVPTNGHPTRYAAIVELYEARVPQKDIAAALGCSRNAVSQVVFTYRQRTGRIIPPAYEVPNCPALSPDTFESPYDFCMKSYQKSVAGARQALEAMGL